MPAVATDFVQISPGAEDAGQISADQAARRARRRLTMLYFIAGSYAIDVVILSLYAMAGVTSYAVAVSYGLVATTLALGYLVLSKSGITNAYRDHYLAYPIVIVNTAVELVFFAMAPEVAPVFLTDMFVIFGFSALRLTPREALSALAFVTLGFAIIAINNAHSLVSPTQSPVQKFISLIYYISALGRCLLIGLHGNALRLKLQERTRQLKIAIEKIEQFAQLDELTGILNRRTILRALNDEIARAKRSTQPCSIALIDLDQFKRINDVYGHPAGDEVLRTFAITVFANIRGIDKFGRYGGEEFLLVLPGTSGAEAVRLLDRLRQLIETLDWSGITPGLVPTISSGVAEIREDDTDSLLARCDRALYRAKDSGRNCVVQS